MRGLHYLQSGQPDGWSWVWYNARVQRRGRAHLFRVPLLRLDPDKLRIPAHMLNRPEAWATHAARFLLRFPNHMTPNTIAERLCTTSQPVHAWVLGNDPGRTIDGPQYPRPRGYCEACWDVWLSDEYADARALQDHARPMGTLTNDWESYVTNTQNLNYRREYHT